MEAEKLIKKHTKKYLTQLNVEMDYHEGYGKGFGEDGTLEYCVLVSSNNEINNIDEQLTNLILNSMVYISDIRFTKVDMNEYFKELKKVKEENDKIMKTDFNEKKYDELLELESKLYKYDKIIVLDN